MSDRDLSGRLFGPRSTLPLRPLSNRASTASWSILFSFLMITDGALSSSSLRRLFFLRGHGRGDIDLYSYLFGFGFKIYGPEHLPDRFGAHARLERTRAVLRLRLAVPLLGEKLLVLERGLTRVHDHT